MLSLSDNNQASVVEAFNSTSRYLEDLLNIDRVCTNVVITCIQSLCLSCLYTIKYIQANIDNLYF